MKNDLPDLNEHLRKKSYDLSILIYELFDLNSTPPAIALITLTNVLVNFINKYEISFEEFKKYIDETNKHHLECNNEKEKV